jgi:hypothetical protein
VRAYDDKDGVTAAFNLNILHRLNRELGANFDTGCFRHRARWNRVESRIEMHLESTRDQCVNIPAAQLSVQFAAFETIHTENSYKFTRKRSARCWMMRALRSSRRGRIRDSGMRLRSRAFSNLRARARMAEARNQYNSPTPAKSAVGTNKARTKRARAILSIIGGMIQ